MTSAGSRRAPLVFVSVGDRSAQAHAARVASRLKQNGAAISSVGGGLLKELSDIFVGDTVALETFGFAPSLPAVCGLWKIYGKVKKHLAAVRPDAVLLVDFFGFNAKVGKAAAGLGIPVYYFIPPQIWATRYDRIKTIKKIARTVFITLPFERTIYEQTGVPFEYVGHPLLETTPLSASPPTSRVPLVGFFPGSRSHVIRRHIKIINETAALIRKTPECRGANFALFGLSPLRKAYDGLSPDIEIKYDASAPDIASAGLSAAASVSGTIATELALMGVPTAIFYKVSRFNAFVLRSMLKTKYVSLVNILLDFPVQPEFLQEDARPEKIAEQIAVFLKNPPVGRLSEVRRMLEPPDASSRVADRISADLRAAPSSASSSAADVQSRPATAL